jgi:dissimilatory sulfite reductase (desulfoviridin) alpha/beta subunit
MRWSPEAEAAVKKIPFFVRKKVRARIEKEATQAGCQLITLAEVKATQKRYLNNMSREIKGYQLDACFGPNGCPNRAADSKVLVQQVEKKVKAANLLSFLKKNVHGPLKFHHEFRITFAECPNACSQPQIKDIGIIAACRPGITDHECSLCNACVETCPDQAIHLRPDNSLEFDDGSCLACGQCIKVCPTGTLTEAQKGFRILLAGKLGRHPQLAQEMPGLYSAAEVLSIVEYCLDYFKKHSTGGQRFAEVFTETARQKLMTHL